MENDVTTLLTGAYIEKSQKEETKTNILIPAYIFLVLSLVFGLAMAFITPPLQVPDEHAHFFRAIQIADGTIFYTKGVSSIPKSVIHFVNEFTDREVSLNRYGRQRPEEIQHAFRETLNPGDAFNYKFHGAMAYSPVPYIATSAVALAGRIFDAPPILMLYAGRIANLVLASILTYIALRITPFFKWAFLMLALMPMTVFQRASLSADSLTNALAMLSVALTLYYAYGKVDKLRAQYIVLLSICNIMLSLCKPGYFLISFLIFVIPLKKFSSLRQYGLVSGGIVSVCLLVTMAWALKVSDHVMTNPAMPVGLLSQQRALLLSQPLNFIHLLVQTLAYYYWDYLLTFVGAFGWLEVFVPDWTAILFLLTFVAVSIVDGSTRIHWSARIFSALLFVGGILLVFLPLYLTWTLPGSAVITGVQGRYFIPIIPLLLISFGYQVPALASVMKGGSIAVAVLSLVVATTVLYNRYIAPPEQFPIPSLSDGLAVGYILPDQPVEQSFSCPVEIMHSFSVLFGTYHQKNAGTITVSIKHENQILAAKSIAASEIPNDQWLQFQLAQPFPNCFGEDLIIDITSTGNTNNQGVTVWTFPRYYNGNITSEKNATFDNRVLGLEFNAP